VAAFCNAGFALQSSNLLPYQDNPLILDTISALIILGGLGFGVLVAIHDLLRRRSRQASLHVKLVLSTTAFLAISGLVAFACLEWNHSLSEQEGIALKLHNAWFQSITPRTAGFNSVDMSLLRPATILILMALMFVGASPVSTGGGIKTATCAVLLLAIRAVVTQAGDTEAFGRRIPASIVYRAAAVTTLSTLFIIGGTLTLLATQGAAWAPGASRALCFEGLLFEAISAFGTVGLSLGATPLLDPVGEIVIIGLMLAGRTGPLTVVLLLQQAPQRLRYPKEEVIVG
jgi:trk system potassium uptake protein TrkH